MNEGGIEATFLVVVWCVVLLEGRTEPGRSESHGIVEVMPHERDAYRHHNILIIIWMKAAKLNVISSKAMAQQRSV